MKLPGYQRIYVNIYMSIYTFACKFFLFAYMNVRKSYVFPQAITAASLVTDETAAGSVALNPKALKP